MRMIAIGLPPTVVMSSRPGPVESAWLVPATATGRAAMELTEKPLRPAPLFRMLVSSAEALEKMPALRPSAICVASDMGAVIATVIITDADEIVRATSVTEMREPAAEAMTCRMAARVGISKSATSPAATKDVDMTVVGSGGGEDQIAAYSVATSGSCGIEHRTETDEPTRVAEPRVRMASAVHLCVMRSQTWHVGSSSHEAPPKPGVQTHLPLRHDPRPIPSLQKPSSEQSPLP